MTKIITVEEHFDTPAAQKLFAENISGQHQNGGNLNQELVDFDERVRYMDEYGIDMQVVSDAGNSPQLLDDEHAIAGCREVNDTLAKQMSRHPGRFAGLASLPAGAPEAAATELHRAVTELGFKGALITGLIHGHFLDEPQFLLIFAEAEKLNVPLYLHPGNVSKEERDLLFKSPSYSSRLADMMSLAGWGWHMEQGIQMIRLILSGIFDKFPNLTLISGHWGEFVPNFLERIDEFTGMVKPPLKKKFSEYYRNNVYVTASGMYTKPQMDLAVAEMGTDHVLWSEDYPYLKRREQVARFLEESDLSQTDREKIGHENSEQLFNLD